MAKTTDRCILLTILLVLASPALACDGFDTSEYVLPEPVIQVTPPDNEDGIESCVVVIFDLAEKEGTDGHALLAENANAVYSTPDVDSQSAEWMADAVEKFLFFSRRHEGWRETTYYWVFRY